MSLDSFPRYPLMFGPSPIQRLDRLTEYLEGATVWAKRDDVNSGLAFGGNKVRNSSTWSRTHWRTVATRWCQLVECSRITRVRSPLRQPRPALKCVLIQESWVDWPDVTYDRVGNILLSRLMGADVRLVQAGFGIGFKESWEKAIKEIEDRGGKPYAIPAGASDHPLGGLGFAGWALELEQQEVELGVGFDYVFVCSVTGSTQAGMIAGFAVNDLPARSSASTGRPSREDLGADRAHRSTHGRIRSVSIARSLTRRSSSTIDFTPAPTASPMKGRWKRCASAPRLKG